MKAVSFDVTIPGFLLARSVGRYSEAFVFGRLSGLSLGERPEPELPGSRWVLLDVVSCGICGTDVGNLRFSSSPVMEPFASFPAVLGHEILARVVEVGSDVRRVEAGQRVAVDPMLSCEVRGFAADDRCPSCASGRHSTCERAGEEGALDIGGAKLRRGLTMGYHADLPGGWSERIIAHETQLFPVADSLDDRTAVLIEPLSIGMHAVLQSPPRGGGPVLVIGSGPIAMGTIWALRATGFQGEIVAQTKRKREAEMAAALGASSVVTPDGSRDALIGTGAMAYQPIVGAEVYSGGGFPLIFDCVGNGTSLEQALRYAAARGRIVMLGCAAEIPKLDLTFIWARELDVKGFVGYSYEQWGGGRPHTFEVTHDLLVESGAAVRDMVTHVFPLRHYRDALRAAGNHRSSGAIKVVLEP